MDDDRLSHNRDILMRALEHNSKAMTALQEVFTALADARAEVARLQKASTERR
jgi:hypothetical protein